MADDYSHTWHINESHSPHTLRIDRARQSHFHKETIATHCASLEERHTSHSMKSVASGMRESFAPRTLDDVTRSFALANRNARAAISNIQREVMAQLKARPYELDEDETMEKVSDYMRKNGYN